MAAMGEAIEQRSRHFGIAKHAGPFAEAQVSGDDDAGAFIKFTEKVEQHGAARGAERQISQLVHHQEISFNQHLGNLPSPILGLFLLQCIDQLYCREEPNAFSVMLDNSC